MIMNRDHGSKRTVYGFLVSLSLPHSFGVGLISGLVSFWIKNTNSETRFSSLTKEAWKTVILDSFAFAGAAPIFHLLAEMTFNAWDYYSEQSANGVNTDWISLSQVMLKVAMTLIWKLMVEDVLVAILFFIGILTFTIFST